MSDKPQWPETVDQAVGVLLGLLPEGEKAKIAAMSVLGTIPVFFTVAVMQRYLVRGISMGAVKG